MEKRSDREPGRDRDRRVRKRSDGDEFWDDIGVDVERMGPRAQVVTSLAVLIPVVVASVALLFFFTNFWWLIFFFGWAIFPAFGLLVRGIAGMTDGDGRQQPGGPDAKERELLGALRSHGEVTPTQAAIETSLTVEEADEMLKALAAKGHLDVRVRGGGIFYGLWKNEAGNRELEEGD